MECIPGGGWAVSGPHHTSSHDNINAYGPERSFRKKVDSGQQINMQNFPRGKKLKVLDTFVSPLDLPIEFLVCFTYM